MKDHYYILGISEDATKDDIKRAYRKLSTKFHPDKNQGDQFFEQRFKDINEAYEVLSSDYARRAYDEQRQHIFGKGKSKKKSPPEILKFESSKKSVRINEEFLIRWSTANASEVRINLFGTVENSGQKRIRVKKFQTAVDVIITATNEDGIEAVKRLAIGMKDRNNSTKSFNLGISKIALNARDLSIKLIKSVFKLIAGILLGLWPILAIIALFYLYSLYEDYNSKEGYWNVENVQLLYEEFGPVIAGTSLSEFRRELQDYYYQIAYADVLTKNDFLNGKIQTRKDLILWLNEDIRGGWIRYESVSLENGASPFDECFGKGLYNSNSRRKVIVKNGNASDAIFCLVDTRSGRTIRNEYIQANSHFELTGIPSGIYSTKTFYGNDWNTVKRNNCGSAGNFDLNISYSKSDQRKDWLDLTENGSGYELTLYAVHDGNIQSRNIDATEFFK